VQTGLFGLERCGSADRDALDVLKCKDDADWVQHCMSMAEDDGIRQRGHQMRTWLNHVKEDVKNFSLSRELQVQNKWRRKVKGATHVHLKNGY